MRETKYYKNLPDSIFITALFFLMLLLGIGTSVYTAVCEGFAVCLAFTLLWCGVFIIPLSLAIFFGCYEYWYVERDVLFCKKLFRKVKSIRLLEIMRVEKKRVAVVGWARKYRDAYIVYGNGEKITLVINRKNDQYLKDTFEKHVKFSNLFRK